MALWIPRFARKRASSAEASEGSAAPHSEETPSQSTLPPKQRIERHFRHPDVADELIVPPECSRWKGRRYLLDKSERRGASTQASGVRFQAWDRSGENKTPEQQCQRDVSRLVGSVAHLRDQPDLKNLVLSKDPIRGRSLGEKNVSRVKFGLRLEDGERFENETKGARECHRQIVRAARRAGFVVEKPKSFSPKEGFTGLRAWSDELLLRKRRPILPWLLLPLLLLPLLFLPECESPEKFFGISIDTESTVLIVDVSPSLRPQFEAVRAEAHRLLNELQARGGTRYIDIITFDSNAKSALGDLHELDDEKAQALRAFIDGFQQGGGTRLESAIEIASQEIVRHERPTTVIVLTDGEDSSIPSMLADIDATRARFGDQEIAVHTLTPRLFGDQGDPVPQSDAERQLAQFSEALGGRFGPMKEEE